MSLNETEFVWENLKRKRFLYFVEGSRFDSVHHPTELIKVVHGELNYKAVQIYPTFFDQLPLSTRAWAFEENAPEKTSLHVGLIRKWHH